MIPVINFQAKRTAILNIPMARPCLLTSCGSAPLGWLLGMNLEDIDIFR